MNKVFLYELDLSNKAMNLLFTHHIFCISELADMGSSELSRLFEGDRQSGHQIEARRMWAVQNPDQYEKALPARKTDVLRFKQCAFPELLLHEKDVLVFRDQNLDQIGISQTALRAVRKCGCITLRDLLRVSMGQLTMNMDIKGEVLHDLIARVREIVTVRSPDPAMPAPKIQPAAPSAAPSASGMNGIRFKRVTAGLNLGTAFAPASPERPVPEKGDEPVFETRKEPAASAAVPHPARADADFERFSSRIRTVQELLDGSYSRWMSEQGMKPLFVSELAVPAPVLGALHRGGICFLSQLACTKGKKLRRMLKQDHLSANALLKIRETLLAFPDVWASPLDTQITPELLLRDLTCPEILTIAGTKISYAHRPFTSQELGLLFQTGVSLEDSGTMEDLLSWKVDFPLRSPDGSGVRLNSRVHLSWDQFVELIRFMRRNIQISFPPEGKTDLFYPDSEKPADISGYEISEEIYRKALALLPPEDSAACEEVISLLTPISTCRSAQRILKRIHVLLESYRQQNSLKEGLLSFEETAAEQLKLRRQREEEAQKLKAEMEQKQEEEQPSDPEASLLLDKWIQTVTLDIERLKEKIERAASELKEKEQMLAELQTRQKDCRKQTDPVPSERQKPAPSVQAEMEKAEAELSARQQEYRSALEKVTCRIEKLQILLEQEKLKEQ